MENILRQIRREETSARIAKANRDILKRCVEALEDPKNIKDVAEVLREEAESFDQDYKEACARLRELRNLKK